MDYEFHIQLAEKELAHLREMQPLMRSHQEAHDRSFTVVGSRLDRIEENLENVTSVLKELSLAQAATEQKLQGLIEILTRGERNGRA